MKRVEKILAGAALLGALLAAWPGSAATPTPTVTPTVTPTPTPTLTPTVTPTPLTVSANAVYTLCSISSSSSVCGRIRKAASQSTTAAYLFQVTASGARFDIWVSCDNASGGSTKTAKRSLQYASESYSLPVSEVGPCTVGVTPIWTSGTGVLVASISGDHTMLALPTPAP